MNRSTPAPHKDTRAARRHRGRVHARFLVALAAIFSAPGVGRAAPTWLPPDVISLGGDTCGVPQVAMQGDGSVTVVWLRTLIGAQSAHIEAVDRPAGATYAPPYPLSDSGTSVYDPALAMKTDGEAVVVWPWWSGNVYWIQAAIRPADGTFGPPTIISDPSWSADRSTVTLDPSGRAVAAWEINRVEQNRSNIYVHASVKAPGQPFGAPQAVSQRSDFSMGPVVDSDRSGLGAAVIVWSRLLGRSGSSYADAAVKDASDEGFGTPITISGPVGDADHVDVALDGTGNAMAVWQRWHTTSESWRIQSSFRATGQPFSAPVYLSTAGRNAFNPRVAMDRSGNAVAVWQKRDANDMPRIQASVRPAGGRFGPPEFLSPAGVDAWDPSVAMNDSGTTVVVWRQWDNTYSRYRVFAAIRPPGGPFGSATAISEGDPNFMTYGPSAAIDEDGNAIATWARLHWIVRDQVVEAVGFDAAGPKLLDLWIPFRGAIGEELTFSVRPLDTWSSVVSTIWDFGDGYTAEGNLVSHAYVATGVYDVTVTSTDAVGNTSTASGSVVIDRLGGAPRQGRFVP
ncbi:MAG: PKD domain-containing protein [Nitrospirae bacterium]|nr:PKD domain-containing protein [Nitrospirota bacterium]